MSKVSRKESKSVKTETVYGERRRTIEKPHMQAQRGESDEMGAAAAALVQGPDQSGVQGQSRAPIALLSSLALSLCPCTCHLPLHTSAVLSTH
jgi:hypothetical protein